MLEESTNAAGDMLLVPDKPEELDVWQGIKFPVITEDFIKSGIQYTEPGITHDKSPRS
jgi:hypothetical protein